MDAFGARVDDFTSGLTGLPADQANFILSQLASIPLSFVLRLALPAHKVGENVRHAYCAGIGLFFTLCCFRWQTINVLLPATLLYLVLIMFGRSRILGRMVLVCSMLYLASCHIYRQYTDYGGYKLDITGPLMIMTQKVSTLAYGCCDGQLPENEITNDDHKKHRIRERPSLLRYYSFLFGYMGYQTGPCYFYNDYISFMSGNSYSSNVDQNTNEERQPHTTTFRVTPWSWSVTIKNFGQAIFCAATVTVVVPKFPVDRLVDDDFLASTNVVQRIGYMLVSNGLYRFRYYFAWKLGETICNASGLGFAGWTKDGEQDWSLVKNCSIWKLETATSFKAVFDNWNIQTALWLRYVVYTRIAKRGLATNMVFLVSAFWHGFYPGYYLTFTSGMIYVEIGRKLRKSLRPKFQSSQGLIVLYAVITFLGTHLALSFGTTSMILLRLGLIWKFWKSVYFFMFFPCAVLYFLPMKGVATTQDRPKPVDNQSPAAEPKETHDTAKAETDKKED